MWINVFNEEDEAAVAVLSFNENDFTDKVSRLISTSAVPLNYLSKVSRSHLSDTKARLSAGN